MTTQEGFNNVLSKAVKKEADAKFTKRINRWLRHIKNNYDRNNIFNGNKNILFFEPFNQSDNDIFYKYVNKNTNYKVCKLGAKKQINTGDNCTYLEFKAKWKEAEKTIFIYTPNTDVDPDNFNINTSVLAIDYELPLTIFALIKNAGNTINYIKMDTYEISSCYANMYSMEGKVKIVNNITTIITEYIQNRKKDTNLDNIARYFPFYSIPKQIKKDALQKLIIRHQEERSA
ncbi:MULTISPECIES: hypothetical protein [unclassified Colwellia]|uniref:hypothetical protein n=1 Tax=unclassified Colwellia TaxID=196834 RepID=UPI0015F69584|nr:MULTISPECIES: hypothetical protein [unclassified Colwellia]MBA6231890.1 hypothetical protein [Colwellia sp. MB02u-7]MBA6235937.1 hypothetical protein [Colwellia sp. MB02u-11]MBA6255227.1 hypothetical protein [Colwellia sp. MB3u-28]MBA6258608.1 hypothetical protein [Colwellia sp. MB3u-41]MBA6298647.1 hypothetical protein [Colwellia sp. MB3u-22]